MAEGTGFESAVPLRILLFSRQTLSTTQPPLRLINELNQTLITNSTKN